MKSLYNIKDWHDIQEHQMVGEILMQSGKLTLNALGLALDVQNFERIRLGDILINMAAVSEEDLHCALKLQKQIDDILIKRR